MLKLNSAIYYLKAKIKKLKSITGQATVEYLLATGMFLVIFVFLHGVIESALKKLFAGGAFVMLNSWY
ncbi:hypothetical protein ACFL6Y_11260 [Elusimicrobiota bacterium]